MDGQPTNKKKTEAPFFLRRKFRCFDSVPEKIAHGASLKFHYINATGDAWMLGMDELRSVPSLTRKCKKRWLNSDSNSHRS